MSKDFMRICDDPELEHVKTVHSDGATINIYIKRVSEEEKEKNRRTIVECLDRMGYIAKVPSLDL